MQPVAICKSFQRHNLSPANCRCRINAGALCLAVDDDGAGAAGADAAAETLSIQLEMVSKDEQQWFGSELVGDFHRLAIEHDAHLSLR
jgi:hypothetical protein